jgi:N-acyl-D-amino-acid deacylase
VIQLLSPWRRAARAYSHGLEVGILEQLQRFDWIIRGGTIVDGSGGRAPFVADIGIRGDRIIAVGKLPAHGEPIVDAQGCIVSPGFIDVHVHGELALLGGPDQYAAVSQGITTLLSAPDGFGWAPLDRERAQALFRYTRFVYGDVKPDFEPSSAAGYLSSFGGRIPANLAPQIPHCAVRLRAMGWASRPATSHELGAMQDGAEEWMDAGAVGLCVGLDYQPSVHADLSELVALSRTVADRGGIYAAHIRKQKLGTVGAWEETFEIARQAGIRVHVSHERVDDETAPVLDRASREGIDLSFDAYLYPAGMTHMAILLPLDVQAGSTEEMLDRMRSPHTRARCLPHIREKLAGYGDPLIGYTKSGRYAGTSLSQAAHLARRSREATLYDLILEEEGVEVAIMPWGSTPIETDTVLRRTAQHPAWMVASDGVYNIAHPHPRGYGAFARVLRRFVRQEGALTLQQAVHRMSGYPAERFGLGDRGKVAAGMVADVVVLKVEAVTDRATWADPRRPALGIEWVLVNGQPVIANGVPTGALPGRVVRPTSPAQ